MVVTDVLHVRAQSHAELSARIRWEQRAGETRLWFRVAPERGECLSPRGDAFLAAALLPCMIWGERLVVEAPVSPLLLKASGRIQDILAQWFKGARRVEIRAAATAPPVTSRAAVGSFFSCGVDSFYSLLKNTEAHPADRDSITHLLLIHGFDIPLADEDLFRRTLDNVRKVADTAGKELIEVATNLREFGDRTVKFHGYHGAALAAVGLACGGFFRRVLVPTATTYRDLTPLGAHPLLDPLWSTEATAFVSDGWEATRAEKILGWICRSDLALGTLRVCWKNRRHQYNCAACEKCLRTMLVLHAGDGLARCPTFARSLSPALVKKSYKLRRAWEIGLAEEAKELIARKAEQTPFDRQICAAVESAAERGRRRVARRILRGGSSS